MELYLYTYLLSNWVELRNSTLIEFGTCVFDEMKLVFLIDIFIVELQSRALFIIVYALQIHVTKISVFGF